MEDTPASPAAVASDTKARTLYDGDTTRRTKFFNSELLARHSCDARSGGREASLVVRWSVVNLSVDVLILSQRRTRRRNTKFHQRRSREAHLEQRWKLDFIVDHCDWKFQTLTHHSHRNRQSEVVGVTSSNPVPYHNALNRLKEAVVLGDAA